jgi:membrane protein
MEVPGFRGLRVRDVFKRAVLQFNDDDMATYAAALSYHVFFSIFPFIIFLLALLSFLDAREFFDWLLQRSEAVLPAPAAEQLAVVVEEVREQRRGGLLSFGMVVALWTGSLGLRSTMNALNRAYNIGEGRAIWKRYGLSMLYTIALALLVVAAVALMVIGPQWMVHLAEWVGLEEMVVVLWTWLRIPIALLLMMYAVGLVYYFAPNVRHPFTLVSPGAIVAVLIWVAASLGFSFYVQNFVDYTATYGSVGAVIVLLFYFFISGCALLLGAEINAVIETETTDLEPEDAGKDGAAGKPGRRGDEPLGRWTT